MWGNEVENERWVQEVLDFSNCYNSNMQRHTDPNAQSHTTALLLIEWAYELIVNI